jgi:Methyltransferase domain
MTIDKILERYPKTRPKLPEEYQRIYAEEYLANRNGARLASCIAIRLEQWMHHRVATRQRPGEVLEMGAGTLNHLRYEFKHSAYDVVEPFRELYDESPERSNVRHVYSALCEISETKRYDRIISIAVLEHMTDLPREIAHASRRLDEQGIFQAGIPTEGGALWGCAWRFGTGTGFRLRTGLDYGRLMRYEHVNSEEEIIAVIEYFFGQVQVIRFPLPHKHLSLYTYVEARLPRTQRSEEYLFRNEG